jgi:hypothetical protein
LGDDRLLPPKPANAVFRIRGDGRIYDIGFNNRSEAESAARGHVAPGKRVEIIDGVTGQVVADLSMVRV